MLHDLVNPLICVYVCVWCVYVSFLEWKGNMRVPETRSTSLATILLLYASSSPMFVATSPTLCGGMKKSTQKEHTSVCKTHYDYVWQYSQVDVTWHIDVRARTCLCIDVSKDQIERIIASQPSMNRCDTHDFLSLLVASADCELCCHFSMICWEKNSQHPW